MLGLALGSIVFGHAVDAFAGWAGPAIQLVLPFSGSKVVGLFILGYWCFINETGYRFLLVVMAFEIAIGITGFFADFRAPVLALAIAALAARASFRWSSIMIVSLIGALIFSLAVFWSDIKKDYRDFANGGAGGQGVVQPLDARLDYIYNAAANFDSKQFAVGVDNLIKRHSYIEFLAATLSYVPRLVPHTDGAQIGNAVANMLMPRMFFPDKAPLPNDTEITQQYTGLNVVGTGDQMTSISIGWLGELYIDFGYIGALIATTLLGAAAGFGYSVLKNYKRLPLLVNYGICVMFALMLSEFGTALIKSVDGAVLTFGAAIVTQRIIATRALAYIVRRAKRQPAYASRG